MPAKMITYRFFFFFEGPITEFGNNYRNRFFFPGGLFLNLVIITDRFFPQGAIFESGKKCLKPVLFPGVPFLSQVKKYWKLVALIVYICTFSEFFYCKYSTIQHTYSTHHTQYTTTHSIQDPQYISTAHHIT